jgi:mycofactocin system glycosyltransferase
VAPDRHGVRHLIDAVRYRLDSSWQRFPGKVLHGMVLHGMVLHGAVLHGAVLAGSPLRLFRTTPAGTDVLDRLSDGDDVEPSVLVERLLDAGAIHPDPSGPADLTLRDATIVTPQLRTNAASLVHDDGRITIDDGSMPPLAGATHRLPVTSGPAAARNAARPFIDTELVVFLDADVEPADGWLEPLLAHFDDPTVGLVAPRVTGEVGSPLDLGDEPARIRSGTRVSYVPGAALVVRVAAFDAVGGFDPTLRFGEDVDFVWRLDEAGWRCRYEPAGTVWHEPRGTLGARLRQHADYGTSAAPLALRHPGALSPVRFNGWTAFVWAAIAGGHLVIGGAAAVASSLALGRKLPDVPRAASFRLAMRGHLLAAHQIGAAVRRAWWPIVLVGSLASRRMRWIALGSVLADVRAAPTDVAYGWGLWRGVLRHRTWGPITPRLSAWPGRQPRSTSPPGRQR